MNTLTLVEPMAPSLNEPAPANDAPHPSAHHHTTATLAGTTPFDALTDLPSISLEALAEHAERLTRVDRKYVVPVEDAPEVLAAVRPDAVALEIEGRRSFRYSSTYFDSEDLRSFHDGGRSRRRRFKVRTRSYLDTGAHFLEVKTRGARGTTVKTRCAMTGPITGALGPAEIAFVSHTLTDHGIVGVDAAQLLPTLTVTYTRRTLAFLSDGSRTTIDTDLTWHTGGSAIELPGLAVFETKAGSTPTGVDRTLWRRGHRPVRLSKYGAGLAATHPDLPHLKWHRTLVNPLLAAAS